MKPSKIFKISWKGLMRNKLRSLLTMLGVIIGVAAVIIMVSISAGTEATISEQINSLGTDLLFVSQSFGRGGAGSKTSTAPQLNFDDLDAIKESVAGIIGSSTERNSVETIKYNDVALEEVTLIGTTPDYPSVRDIQVGIGRFFTSTEVDRTSKVVVLGSTIAEELFPEEDPIGALITVGTTKVTVVGVMQEKGTVGTTDYDARIYLPISLVFQKFTPSQFARIAGDMVNTIYLQVDPEEDIDEMIFKVELYLSKAKDVDLDELPFTVTTQQDIIDTQESTTAAFRSLLAWVAAVSLIVGGIGIMNIMLVSVTERTREIGVRQAIGASPADIRWQFLTEAILLSLAGGLIGIVVGIGGSLLYGAFGGMRTLISASSIILAFLSAAGVGTFFGYYPANTASKLDPIEALRHE
jgi:putative ABC transport system permease protein